MADNTRSRSLICLIIIRCHQVAVILLTELDKELSPRSSRAWPEPSSQDVRQLVGCPARPPQDVERDLDEIPLVDFAVNDELDPSHRQARRLLAARQEKDRPPAGVRYLANKPVFHLDTGARPLKVFGQTPVDELSRQPLEYFPQLFLNLDRGPEVTVRVFEVARSARPLTAAPCFYRIAHQHLH